MRAKCNFKYNEASVNGHVYDWMDLLYQIDEKILNKNLFIELSVNPMFLRKGSINFQNVVGLITSCTIDKTYDVNFEFTPISQLTPHLQFIEPIIIAPTGIGNLFDDGKLVSNYTLVGFMIDHNTSRRS